MYLMFADTPVLYFDFDDFIVEVINEQFYHIVCRVNL